MRNGSRTGSRASAGFSRSYPLGIMAIFAAYAGADFLTTESDNVIVMSQPLGNYARAAVDFVVSEYGATTIGVIAGDYSYLDSYYIGMDDQTEQLGVTWQKEIFTAGTVAVNDPDFVRQACSAFPGRVAITLLYVPLRTAP